MKLTCIPLYAVCPMGSTVEKEYDGILILDPCNGIPTLFVPLISLVYGSRLAAALREAGIIRLIEHVRGTIAATTAVSLEIPSVPVDPILTCQR